MSLTSGMQNRHRSALRSVFRHLLSVLELHNMRGSSSAASHQRPAPPRFLSPSLSRNFRYPSNTYKCFQRPRSPFERILPLVHLRPPRSTPYTAYSSSHSSLRCSTPGEQRSRHNADAKSVNCNVATAKRRNVGFMYHVYASGQLGRLPSMPPTLPSTSVTHTSPPMLKLSSATPRHAIRVRSIDAMPQVSNAQIFDIEIQQAKLLPAHSYSHAPTWAAQSALGRVRRGYAEGGGSSVVLSVEGRGRRKEEGVGHLLRGSQNDASSRVLSLAPR